MSSGIYKGEWGFSPLKSFICLIQIYGLFSFKFRSSLKDIKNYFLGSLVPLRFYYRTFRLFLRVFHKNISEIKKFLTKTKHQT